MSKVRHAPASPVGVANPAPPGGVSNPNRSRRDAAGSWLAAARAALVGAWAESAVRRGLVGVFFITLGSLTPSYLPAANPINQLALVQWLHTPVGVALGTALLLLGVGLLVDAWLALRPARAPHVSLPAVVAIWSLPFLLAPPIFSADAYAYAAEGWLMMHGLNPYDFGVGAVSGPLAEQTAMVWRWTPAPYGPLALTLNHLITAVFQGHAYWAVVGMRLPVLAAVALLAVVLPRIARQLGVSAQLVLWLSLVNPLLLVHFVGGIHNDAIMVALVVLALYLALRGRWLLPVVLVAAAAGIKLPAIFAIWAVAVLADPVLSRHHPLSLAGRRPGWVLTDLRERVLRTLGRGLLASVAVVAVFASINFATGLGIGWLPAMNVPGMVFTMSPSTVLGELLSQVFYSLGLYDWALTSVRVVRTLFMVGCVALIGWLALSLSHRRPITSLTWSLLAVALCGPVLHGWYLSWAGTLLGLSRPSRGMLRACVWVSAGLLAYIATVLAWRNGVTVIGVAGLGLIAWRLRLFDVAHRDELGGVPGPGWRELVPRPWQAGLRAAAQRPGRVWRNHHNPSTGSTSGMNR